jgi:hypothetical protein
MLTKLNLHNIENEYLLLAQKVIDNDGVIDDETSLALAINLEQLETKGKSYGFIIKTLDSEVEMIEKEVERLKQLKDARVRTADQLKERLLEAMELFDIVKLESPLLKISLKKSERVEANQDLVPKEYLNRKETFTVDKVKIKADIKAGKSIVGAVITTHNNLQIK